MIAEDAVFDSVFFLSFSFRGTGSFPLALVSKMQWELNRPAEAFEKYPLITIDLECVFRQENFRGHDK